MRCTSKLNLGKFFIFILPSIKMNIALLVCLFYESIERLLTHVCKMFCVKYYFELSLFLILFYIRKNILNKNIWVEMQQLMIITTESFKKFRFCSLLIHIEKLNTSSDNIIKFYFKKMFDKLMTYEIVKLDLRKFACL